MISLCLKIYIVKKMIICDFRRQLLVEKFLRKIKKLKEKCIKKFIFKMYYVVKFSCKGIFKCFVDLFFYIFK